MTFPFELVGPVLSHTLTAATIAAVGFLARAVAHFTTQIKDARLRHWAEVLIQAADNAITPPLTGHAKADWVVAELHKLAPLVPEDLLRALVAGVFEGLRRTAGSTVTVTNAPGLTVAPKPPVAPAPPTIAELRAAAHDAVEREFAAANSASAGSDFISRVGDKAP